MGSKKDQLPLLVTRGLVIAAYQGLLEREPESEEAITEKMRHYKTAKDLLRALVETVEFTSKNGSTPQFRNAYPGLQNKIDVDVTPEVFVRMFARVKDQWMALGESEPFWSVLSKDRFRMGNIEDSKEEFYASGANEANPIDIFCQRTLINPPTGTCLELGCGVGRVTKYLAQRFDHVVGIDISQGNLDLAQRYLRESGVENVSWMLLRDPEQLQEVRDYDFFHSVITLQHNPPPIIAKLLRIILKKITPRGSFLFQVPTHTPGYTFNADTYLESPVARTYEMHALPMHIVLEIIVESGAQAKEVILDTLTGSYGSHTFFGIKA